MVPLPNHNGLHKAEAGRNLRRSVISGTGSLEISLDSWNEHQAVE